MQLTYLPVARQWKKYFLNISYFLNKSHYTAYISRKAIQTYIQTNGKTYIFNNKITIYSYQVPKTDAFNLKNI